MRPSFVRSAMLLELAVSLALFYAPNCKANAILVTNFPITPTPAILAIPSGGFTLGQTFAFTSVWSNDWDLPLMVTFNYNVTEIDPLFNDEFRKSFSFGLPASARNVPVNIFPPLTATELNSANDVESGQLEFQIDSPEFTFSHVPEPGSWGLFLVGGLGVAWVKCRRRKGVRCSR